MSRRATFLPRAVAAVTAAIASPAPACEPALRGDGVARVEGKEFVLAWRPQPPIRLAEFFTLDIAVCRRDAKPAAASLRVDARMPEHNHGMNYRPRVFPRGGGRFEVTGLLLHMQGRWQMSFEAQAPDAGEVLRADVAVN